MIKKKQIVVYALAILISGCATQSAHWGYSGDGGAKNWATLSADNFACSGKNQSPINLSGFIEADLSPIQFNYKTGGHEILNNGHTIQINYEKGSSIKVDGITFHLLQFHFHAPSENHINDKSYPLEVHFVHADSDGNLAVVAVMYEEGVENIGLKNIWSAIPKHAGEKNSFSKLAGAEDFIPKNRDYYRFNGSLTTPPCSEGVRWLVIKSIETASKQQIAAFTQVLLEPNNRPLQAINARTVLQ